MIEARDASALYESVAITALIVSLACYYGWVNSDSIAYLSLADNVLAGKGLALHPSWGEPYFAVFPAGYPLAIAFVKLLAATSTLVASKILNGGLLLGSLLLASRLTQAPMLLLSSLFFSVPFLQITDYTCSETLFIFFNLLALWAMERYGKKSENKWLIVYFLGLVLAVFSRYIGGFLLVVYFALIRRMIGKNTLAGRARIATLCAGVLFVAYLLLNKWLTGYITGASRPLPAESYSLLFNQMISSTMCDMAFALFPPFVVFFAMMRDISLKKIRPPSLDALLPKESIPLVFLGGGYLFLLFILRCFNSFDSFTNRLLMPGLVFLVLGLIKAVSSKYRDKMIIGISTHCVFLYLVIMNLSIDYNYIIENPALAVNESAKNNFDRYAAVFGPLEAGTVIIPVDPFPSLGWKVDSSPLFAEDRLLQVAAYTPPSVREELPAYRRRLANVRYRGSPPVGYLFDFNNIPDRKHLDILLKDKGVPLSVAAWIRSHFSPNRFVRCPECSYSE